MNTNISYYKGGDSLAIWAADVCIQCKTANMYRAYRHKA